MNNIISYINLVYKEITEKVTWPSHKNIQSKVLVVVVFCVVFSLGIAGVDYMIKKIIEVFFELF